MHTLLSWSSSVNRFFNAAPASGLLLKKCSITDLCGDACYSVCVCTCFRVCVEICACICVPLRVCASKLGSCVCARRSWRRSTDHRWRLSPSASFFSLWVCMANLNSSKVSRPSPLMSQSAMKAWACAVCTYAWAVCTYACVRVASLSYASKCLCACAAGMLATHHLGAGLRIDDRLFQGHTS